ncbi:ankyrin repeat domain-containing protein [Candidatus Tisiphia endosymbiont of Nedyus quadrimaculatus]|uniref:ankyrin repeat domain-containing protein n=1 Tax=Candidatus Tisiphia endosymbiont of Nedyus quadrimaculatus TaxID=3139332 RepID=UPI00345E0B27
MARFIDRLTLLNIKDLGTINKEGILISGDLDEIAECIGLGVNFFRLSLLEIPIIRNNLDVFNLIMDSSSDDDLHRRPATNLEYVDKRTIGEKLLFAACRHNRFDMIKKLLDFGVDVNATDIDKVTPLHEFIQYMPHRGTFSFNDLGYSGLEVVQELICRGANVNATSRHNSTALCKAAHLGAVSIVEELIKNSAQSIMPISYAQTVDTTIQQEIDALLKIPTAFKNKDWSTVTELLETNKNHIAIQRLYDMGCDSDLSLIIHYTQNALAIDGGLLHNLESQDNQQEESSILGQLVQYCTIL